MTDLPILFSAPMVRALLDGRKTQARRILKPQPDDIVAGFRFQEEGPLFIALDASGKPVYGFPWGYVAPVKYKRGDRLWVREAWRAHAEHDRLPPRDIPPGSPVQYLADDPLSPWDSKTRQSMFMPRWASRLALVVTDVRVQRLQGIDHRDAAAEGWPGDETERARAETFNDCDDACLEWYADLWDSINGPGAWEQNPWVAAYTLAVHKCNIDQMGSP